MNIDGRRADAFHFIGSVEVLKRYAHSSTVRIQDRIADVIHVLQHLLAFVRMDV